MRPGRTLVAIAVLTTAVVVPIAIGMMIALYAFATEVSWSRHLLFWAICAVPAVVVGLFAGAAGPRGAGARRGDRGCLLASVGTLLVLAPLWALAWTTARSTDGTLPDPTGPWVAAVVMTAAGTSLLVLAHGLLSPTHRR
ncbi:hypothetical protein [Aeromicrobium massiliense]|uniref:hypothetical protein n=1 Tax=Aeromicrobium massiliense TaxID=1464554 RepID=UPI0002FA6BAF|nr:hypothetical protein [Aeromicrobium massiliense]